MATESRIHPTAVIDPGAELADNVEVGAFAVIEKDVSIASGCSIASHAILRRYSRLGENVQIDSFAVIGGLPQDLSFDPEIESGVLVGKNTVFREGVTVHRSTQVGACTRLGENCLLMANAHVAHDCQLSDKVILANNVMLGGHVHVGEGSFLGGGCGIHQFVTIGKFVMVAGNAAISYDIPSFLMSAERNISAGLNILGLKRNLSEEAISDLRSCYKAVYMKPGDPVKLAKKVKAKTPEGRHFIACFASSRRGRFIRSRVQQRGG